MVARAAHVTKNISATTAPLIITQATPHTRPVIVTDPSIEDFYDKVRIVYICLLRGEEPRHVGLSLSVLTSGKRQVI